jgi:uncharacterized protein involved in exopolysaccharide biosynthesis
MSTLRQVLTAARELDRSNDLVDELQGKKSRLQNELADVNAQLNTAQADRNAKRDAFKTLVGELV